MKNAIPKLKWFFVFAIAGVFAISSCKKKDSDESPEPSPTQPAFETQSSHENAIAEGSFDDAENMASEAVEGNLTSYKEGGSSWTPCASLTIDTVSTPKSIIMDWGTSDSCTSIDGRKRKGKIYISFNKKPSVFSSFISIYFIDYYVDGNKVYGYKSFENKGIDTLGNFTFHVVANGGVVPAGQADSIKWNCDRTRVWKTKKTFFDKCDDEMWLTGTANGSNLSGETFTANITRPLVRIMTDTTMPCFWYKHFVSGTLEFTPGTKEKRIIDFGNGAKDNVATVTVGTVSTTIQLK